MKRFLFIALTAGLLSPIATKAEPIPGISDLNIYEGKPYIVEFDCPERKTSERIDGRIQEKREKNYPRCWAEFHPGYINVMDRQVINKKDIVHYHFWEVPGQFDWYFYYKNKDETSLFLLKKHPGMFFKWSDYEEINKRINHWMAQ